MVSMGQKGIVVKLEGIPIVKRKSAVQSRREARKTTADAGAGVIACGEGAKRRVRGGGINRRDRQVVGHGIAVVAQARGIEQGWGESVGPFQRGDVARGFL